MNETQPQNQKQTPQNLGQPENPNYVPTVPVEPAVKNPGTFEGTISIVCAVIALLFLPPLFGIVGIIMGVRAKEKGATRIGWIGISLSIVFMIIGLILSYYVNFKSSRLKAMSFF